MTEDQFKNLQEGDIIKHKTKTNAMTVVGKVDDGVILQRIIVAYHANEWDLRVKISEREFCY